MKKYTSFALTALLCVVMAGAAFAAIGSGGGTENFESVGTLANGDQIIESKISNISGWSYYETCSAPFFYYDNDDTTGFGTASGAGEKPAGAGCLRVYTISSTTEPPRIGSTEISAGRTITLTGWFAVKTPPVGQSIQFAIHFPLWEAAANKGRIHMGIFDTAGDVGFKIRREFTTTADDVNLSVGSSDSDGTDYALNTWNKVEISVTSSDTATGQVQISFNGSPVGSPVDIVADPLEKFLTARCNVTCWPSMTTGEVYIDDLTVQTDSGVDEWMMFE